MMVMYSVFFARRNRSTLAAEFPKDVNASCTSHNFVLLTLNAGEVLLAVTYHTEQQANIKYICEDFSNPNNRQKLLNNIDVISKHTT